MTVPPADPGELESVHVCVPDHYGRLAGKQVAASRLSALAASGLAMPDFHLVTDPHCEPVLGLAATGYHTGFPNDVLWPQLSTLRRLPWDEATGIVLAEARRPDGTLIPQAPRAILQHQIDRLATHGLSASVATELEFYVYHESYQKAQARGFRRMTPMYHRSGDNDVLVTGFLGRYLGPLRAAMAGLGMPAETTQGEGGPGQAEMNFPASDPVAMADGHALFKLAAKAIAHQQRRSVTFMAKPEQDHAGSSCHVHLSLRDTAGEPCTAGTEDAELSPLAQRFLAGLLRFAPELCLMFAPFPNSYTRLQPGGWAPSTVTWGYDNRTTMVRVVGTGPSLRMEFRLPGADANPYLAIAGALAAGIGGLEEPAADLPPPCTGPSSDEASCGVLPADLAEAVERFERSKLARGALGEAVCAHIAGMARHQLQLVRQAVTDWDLRQGFETY